MSSVSYYSRLAAALLALSGTGVHARPETGVSHATRITAVPGTLARRLSCSQGSHSTWSPCSRSIGVGQNATGSTTVTLSNTSGSSDEYTFACTAGARMASCSTSPSIATINGGASRTVTVTFTARDTIADDGLLTVTANSTTSSDVATVTIDAEVLDTRGPPTISLASHNDQNLNRSLCANSCFDGTTSYSTPAYFTKDQPRNVTLVYDTRQASALATVTAEITDTSKAPANKVSVQLITSTGAIDSLVASNSSLKAAELFLTGGSSATRVTMQIDGHPRGTSVITDTLVVRSYWTIDNTVKTSRTPVRIIIIDEKGSPFGRGWTLAGLRFLRVLADSSVLITEGDGSATFYQSQCSTACHWLRPEAQMDSIKWISPYWVRFYPDGSTIFFTQWGHQKYVKDRFRTYLEYGYGTGDRLIGIWDEKGKQTSFHYDANGMLDTIQDPGGRRTAIVHAPSQALTDIYDPSGNRTQYEYKSGSQWDELIAIIDPRGERWSKDYDAALKVAHDSAPSVTVAGGSSTRPTTTYRSAEGATFVGPACCSSASPHAHVAVSSLADTIIDPVGNRSTIVRNRLGEPTRTTDALGRTTSLFYANGLPTSVTRPSGAIDSVIYDASGRVTMSMPSGENPAFTAYDAMGQPDSTWGSSLPLVRYFKRGPYQRYDSVAVGRTNPRVTRYYYRDTLTWMVDSTMDPKRHVTVFHYDSTWHNTDTTNAPANLTVSHEVFDLYGRPTTDAAPMSAKVYTTFDALNRLTRTRRGSSGADSVGFTYDSTGNLTQVRDGKGQRTVFTYNAAGWKTAERDVFDTTKSILYAYDAAGRLVEFTNRRGQSITLTYDHLGRIVKRTGSGIAQDTTAYDASTGAVSFDSNTVAVHRYYRRSNGWTDSMSTKLAGRTFVTHYVPDAWLRLDSVYTTRDTLVAPRLTFAPRRYFYSDSTGDVDSVRVGSGAQAQVARFTYDKDGERTGTVTPSRWNRAERYTSQHARFSESFTSWSASARLAWHGVGTDTLGRISRYLTDSTTALVQRFRYDSAGQLIRVDTSVTRSAACAADTLNYGYLCGGAADTLPVAIYRYDAVGNERAGTGSDTSIYSLGNRMLRWPGDTMRYDADGNRVWRKHLSSGDSTNYFWSADGLLDSVKVGSVRRLEYQYDALGQLVRKRLVVSGSPSDSTLFLWDQGHLLAELTGTGTKRIAEYAYLLGTDRPLALITGDTLPTKTRFFVQDMLGNVTTVTGPVVSDEGVDQSISYDAWGKQTSVTGTLADTNRLRWKGLVWEGDSTQMYYMRNRWYDATMHRFGAQDAIGLLGGINTYRFGNNDPIGNRDPTGLCVPACLLVALPTVGAAGTSVFGAAVGNQQQPEAASKAIADFGSGMAAMARNNVVKIGFFVFEALLSAGKFAQDTFSPQDFDPRPHCSQQTVQLPSGGGVDPRDKAGQPPDDTGKKEADGACPADPPEPTIVKA